MGACASLRRVKRDTESGKSHQGAQSQALWEFRTRAVAVLFLSEGGRDIVLPYGSSL